MECRGIRRSRRRSRGIAESTLYRNCSSLYKSKNYYIAGVVFLAFLMLQRNYTNYWKNYNAKQELIKITTYVEDVAKNLNTIQTNYQVMEDKVATYSKELPKLQEQIEEIAQVIEVQRLGWNPRIRTPLPYVDIKLNTRNPSRNPTRNTPRNKAISPIPRGQMNATLIM